MKSLVFATGNPNKIKEVHEILSGEFEILSLPDIGCPEDLPETNPTLEGNALQKARFVAENFGVNCFAEDTGLEIKALNGEPGVFSARYAGENKNPDANIELVLKKMQDASDRSARFKTVIALILDGQEYLFEGIAEGKIRREKSGAGGFGYDPIFQPDNFDTTFAEMQAAEKNAISHRGKAVCLLTDFLKRQTF
ncbi:MAG: non-canonical purine NTP diphosphatase [Bacteroidota bacterium]